jgi:hypothetical protein
MRCALCSAEYRDGVVRCVHCDLPIVGSSECGIAPSFAEAITIHFNGFRFVNGFGQLLGTTTRNSRFLWSGPYDVLAEAGGAFCRLQGPDYTSVSRGRRWWVFGSAHEEVAALDEVWVWSPLRYRKAPVVPRWVCEWRLMVDGAWVATIVGSSAGNTCETLEGGVLARFTYRGATYGERWNRAAALMIDGHAVSAVRQALVAYLFVVFWRGFRSESS